MTQSEFETWLIAHYQDLYGFGTYLAKDDGPDLVQEVLERVLPRVGELDASKNVLAFIKAKMVWHMREHRTEQIQCELPDDLQAPEPSTGMEPMSYMELTVRDIMSHLPPQHQDVLWGLVNGDSLHAQAAASGQAPSTVARRAERARQKFRRLMAICGSTKCSSSSGNKLIE